jgi:hypothetical protein
VWVRVALVAFVFAWILGPRELRGAVPIVVVFVVALGLEAWFVIAALRGGPTRAPDRGPQEVDRDRFGFPDDVEDADSLGDVEGAEDIEDEGELEDEAWYPPEASPSPLRQLAVGVGLIGVLVGAVWLFGGSSGWGSLPGERRAEAVERFSEEASEIAGRPVSIRCDEARDYVGVVQHADGVAIVGGELAILTPEICHELYRVAIDAEVRGARTGRAIAVLAHEAWHLRGERDEGRTECFGLQSGVGLGMGLGLGEAEVRQLMRQQLTENELRGLATLEYRVGPECRDGGALDLDPTSDAFP